MTLLARNTVCKKLLLKVLNPAFEYFEVEELTLYPSVEERLKRLKVSYITGIGLKTYLLSRFEPHLSLDGKYGSIPSLL